jgi:hypothetical protein
MVQRCTQTHKKKNADDTHTDTDSNTRINDAARRLLDVVDVDVQLLLKYLVLTFDGNCANLVKTKIMIGVVQQIFRF